ncbi:hypothetical protein V1514DRAFT_357594 [Lipomyces japonicus]|uniref:uncharacterized protein n=1 Tax=Lipomyces japonicus TaxID=56871 RepID=UPI0034CF44B1
MLRLINTNVLTVPYQLKKLFEVVDVIRLKVAPGSQMLSEEIVHDFILEVQDVTDIKDTVTIPNDNINSSSQINSAHPDFNIMDHFQINQRWKFAICTKCKVIMIMILSKIILEMWSNYIHNVQNESSLRTIEPPIKAFQECLYKAYETAQEILTSYKLFAPKDILEAGGLLYKRSVSSLKSKASAEHVFQSPSSQYQSTEIEKRHLRGASSFPPSKSNVNITGYSDLDATSRSRTAALPNRHFLIKTVRDVLNMGVTLYHVENDLILKFFKVESVRTSRLSSVIMANPSKRLSIGSRPLSA